MTTIAKVGKLVSIDATSINEKFLHFYRDLRKGVLHFLPSMKFILASMQS